MDKHFDYIVLGFGLSGAIFSYYLNKKYPEKKVLVIENNKYSLKNKTISFWKRKDSEIDFDNIISKRWSNVSVNTGKDKEYVLDKYEYCTVHGNQLYDYIFKEISSNNNISFINDSVISIPLKNDKYFVQTTNNTYYAQTIFNSIYTQPKLNNKEIIKKQHFRGYRIKVDSDIFNPKTVSFMDFNNNDDWHFFYTLPYSKSEALVEEVSLNNINVGDLEKYIEDRYKVNKYNIEYIEQGCIPMTDYKFNRFDKNIVNIGVNGGGVKPSTGYAFNKILKQVDEYFNNKQYSNTSFYSLTDTLILNIMEKYPNKLSIIFKNILNNNIENIFEFLDEESNLFKICKIGTRLIPVSNYFIKAYLYSIINR